MAIRRYHSGNAYLQGLMAYLGGFGEQKRAYELLENQQQQQINQNQANAVGGAAGNIGTGYFKGQQLRDQRAFELEKIKAAYAEQQVLQRQRYEMAAQNNEEALRQSIYYKNMEPGMTPQLLGDFSKLQNSATSIMSDDTLDDNQKAYAIEDINRQIRNLPIVLVPKTKPDTPTADQWEQQGLSKTWKDDDGNNYTRDWDPKSGKYETRFYPSKGNQDAPTAKEIGQIYDDVRDGLKYKSVPDPANPGQTIEVEQEVDEGEVQRGVSARLAMHKQVVEDYTGKTDKDAAKAEQQMQQFAESAGPDPDQWPDELRAQAQPAAQAILRKLKKDYPDPRQIPPGMVGNIKKLAALAEGTINVEEPLPITAGP